MNPNLSPDQFFHGTSVDIPEGSDVVPANEAGHAASEGYYRSNELSPGTHHARSQVYMADRPEESWMWAQNASQTLGGRPRVYRVEPEGEPHVTWTGARAVHATASRAKVVDTEWTPSPGHPIVFSRGGSGLHFHEVYGGVQGTLPPLNWAQHYDKDRASASIDEEYRVRGEAASQKRREGRLGLLRAAGRVTQAQGTLPGMAPSIDPGAVEKLRAVGRRGRDQRAWEKEMFG